tara:strand:+ start:627 stop:920 length:294 start_codon:yes stop_codon:yes gene_type:complete
MKKDIFDEYAKTIAKKFHISIDEMFSKNRRRDIIDARQMLYYLCMERPMRISYIQRFMNANGLEVTHSNILHQYKKAKQLIDDDSDFQELIKNILNE